jgi:hypothetical protein
MLGVMQPLSATAVPRPGRARRSFENSKLREITEVGGGG